MKKISKMPWTAAVGLSCRNQKAFLITTTQTSVRCGWHSVSTYEANWKTEIKASTQQSQAFFVKNKRGLREKQLHFTHHQTTLKQVSSNCHVKLSKRKAQVIMQATMQLKSKTIWYVWTSVRCRWWVESSQINQSSTSLTCLLCLLKLIESLTRKSEWTSNNSGI